MNSKKDVQVIFDVLDFGIKKAFPTIDAEKSEYFMMQFIIFIIGIYPYTHPTKKQMDAMFLAGVKLPQIDEEKLCYEGILHLTENM